MASQTITRFLNKIRVSDTFAYNGSPCWEWVGCVHPLTGYGQFRWDSILGNPHRYAYWFFTGSIPDKFEVDHLCQVRHCCNPLHLEAVTLQENRRRRDSNRTHCINGHEFNERNAQIIGNRHRCRICNAQRQREFQHRKKLSLVSSITK